MAIGRRAVAPPQPAGARQVAPARLAPIGAGQDRQHAGRLLGARRVDRADAGMRVRRAQHVSERHARQHEIIDVAAPAAQQPRILEARHRLPQREFAHLRFPRLVSRRHQRNRYPPPDITRTNGSESNRAG